MLCQRCKVVFTSYLMHLPSHPKSTQYMTHHTSLESFGRSITEGCQVCSVLAETINYKASRKNISNLIHLPFQLLQTVFTRSTEPPIYFVETEGMTPLQELKSKAQRPKLPIFTEFQGQLKEDGSCSIINLMIRTENARHLPFAKPWRDRESFVLQRSCDVVSLLQNHERSSNTGDDKALRQVRYWYRECVENHIFCNGDPLSTDYCPTRLLDIGVLDGEHDDKVFLIETKMQEKRFPYMTLSHCWGTIPLFRHTAHTAQKLRSGIQLEGLPRTFQDAVKVARYLNCQHLWIDSLCIIQDDPNDWEMEAALMDKVYTHSMCNIAATGASNSLEGLFFERNPEFASPCIADFRTADNEGPESYMIVQQWARQHSLLDQPLQKRGWVLQERRLARRLVDFSSRELLWQCREREASETFPLGFPSTVLVKVEESIPVTLKKSFEDEDQWIKHAYIFIAWADLVQDYTERSLTQPGDKLIAIAGIAKHIQERIHTKYVAGLWLEALPQQLLWYVPNVGASDWYSERAADYRAPSWSWASIDGKIVWGGSLHQNNDEETIADVLDVDVIPRSERLPLGSLIAGSIKVNANLWPIKLDWNQENNELALKTGDTGLAIGPDFMCCLDVLETMELGSRKFFCMPVQYVKREPNQALLLAGLLLEQIDESGERFSRIGYYEEGMKYTRVYYSVGLGKEQEGKREITII